MNLPNYFLVDLPPEATLSPVMLTEACQTLKRNRERYLAGRSTHHLVKVLSEVAEAWRKPDNTFRKLALELGPAETNFSRETLKRGLDGFFRQITRDNLHALLVQEFGDADYVTSDECRVAREPAFSRHSPPATRHFWRGPEFLVHIAAGNIQSHLDEHGARFAGAFGAIREMRQRFGVPAAAVRTFALRG
jgi:hypothetical protein